MRQVSVYTLIIARVEHDGTRSRGVVFRDRIKGVQERKPLVRGQAGPKGQDSATP